MLGYYNIGARVCQLFFLAGLVIFLRCVTFRGLSVARSHEEALALPLLGSKPSCQNGRLEPSDTDRIPNLHKRMKSQGVSAKKCKNFYFRNN